MPFGRNESLSNGSTGRNTAGFFVFFSASTDWRCGAFIPGAVGLLSAGLLRTSRRCRRRVLLPGRPRRRRCGISGARGILPAGAQGAETPKWAGNRGKMVKITGIYCFFGIIGTKAGVFGTKLLIEIFDKRNNKPDSHWPVERPGEGRKVPWQKIKRRAKEGSPEGKLR